MDSINLNIDDYNNNELRQLFNLPLTFTNDNVNNAKKILEKQLIQKNDMSSEEKQNIIFFLDTVTNRLKNQTQQASTKEASREDKKKEKNEGTWSETVVPIQEHGSNILIENPNTIEGKNSKIVGGRSAISGEAPPGWLNPVNVKSIMQGVTIDSRFRKNYFNTTSSDFSVELPSIQRNCTTMRVAAIELPMTYYAISAALNNNTFIISCNYYSAQLEGSRFEGLAGNGSGFSRRTDVSNAFFASPDEIPQYNYNFPWIPNDNLAIGPNPSNINHPFGGLDPLNPGGSVRMWPISNKQIGLLLENAAVPPVVPWKNGAFPVGTGNLLDEIGTVVGLPGDKIPAWKVTIPDGNYNTRFNDSDGQSFIETAVNKAISLAQPGYLDQESGFSNFNPVPITEASQLNPNCDIKFTVDRTSGRGIFAAPQIIDPSDTKLGLSGWAVDESSGTSQYNHNSTGMTGTKFENHGFTLRWLVDKDGSLELEENAQVRFGWQLGFRAGGYRCGGVPYTKNFRSDGIGFFFDNYNDPQAIVPNDRSTIGSAVSEGITLISGPRYCFISINDHIMSRGPNMVVAYDSSTLDNDIITRINLSATIHDVGVYRMADDPGSTTQLNRQREYFGPVDIQRLDIRLLDEYGRILDLNNMDWSFTLAFEKLYT